MEIEPTEPGDPPNWVRKYQKARLIKEKPKEERVRLGERIKEMDVDVLCVQEVEDIAALREFNSEAVRDGGLGGMYPYVALIEGNDPRFIDVGVLSKLPLGGLTSWQHTRHPRRPVRSDLQPRLPRDRRPLTRLQPSRAEDLQHTPDIPLRPRRRRPRRRTRGQEQAPKAPGGDGRRHRRQAHIEPHSVPDLRRSERSAGLRASGAAGAGAEAELVNALENPQQTRPFTDDPPPPSDVWTHRFRDSKNRRTNYELFDHVWLGPALASRLEGAFINRRKKKTKDGSDHDPPFVELDLR